MLALLPSVANLVLIKTSQIISAAGVELPEHLAHDQLIVTALGNGFILTAMLWGGLGAHLGDKSLIKAAAFLGICAVFTAFGIIHSVDPTGKMYLPWQVASDLPARIAAGYALFALLLVGMHFKDGLTSDATA
jgi:AGZA family xanthine/uracil permease-like MFS transporter